jgi:hypothetical protein
MPQDIFQLHGTRLMLSLSWHRKGQGQGYLTIGLNCDRGFWLLLGKLLQNRKAIQ